MKNATEGNPFAPGAGRTPPLLAGREKETELLRSALHCLTKPRAKGSGLKQGVFPPIRIVAPPGGGRRSLLAWIEQEALQRGIRVARSSCPEPIYDSYKPGDGMVPPILATMVPSKNSWVGGAADRTLRRWLGRDIDHRQAGQRHGIPASSLIRKLPAKKPFLLIVDDIQNYNLDSIDTLLFLSQNPISRGHPFALVLAGTPAMDMRLIRTKARFIDRAKHVYIGALSDEATREALRTPFEQAGFAVAPDALEALAAQTDNYPFFIQVVGQAAWDAMMDAGLREVDIALAMQIEKRTREGRDMLYDRAFFKMRASNLMPYAHQVLELLERNGGQAPQKAIFDLLHDASGCEKGSEVFPLYEALHEDGLIWTKGLEVKPGIPSFFSCCKARDRKEGSLLAKVFGRATGRPPPLGMM